jgi:hypothetical protein
MCPLRRVEDQRAGPSALGILVPPGRRTFLILRPRSLSWDLLLCHPGTNPTFRELRREEAEVLALNLLQALRQGLARAEVDACPHGGFWLRVRVGALEFLACGRRPGQPYQPWSFADSEIAQTAGEQLRAVLNPSENVEQEVYLNNRHFDC